MRLKSYIGILLSILLIDTITRTLGKLVRITGLSCQVVDPTFCQFENCVLKAKSRDFKELSMVVRLLQIPVDNITINVEIFRRSYTTQILFQTVIDGCKFLTNKRRNPIAIAIYRFFRMDEFTNINHSCPYNHDLVVDHLPFDKSLNLRLPIGKGEYVLKMHWKTYNVLRTIIDVNIHIID
ncbi:hypothetical protein KR215_003323 [Drosophila sulfurigaster]|nr:hypothetical protein KR215_003323 [Drosophila sulfurigaster]